MGVYVYAAVVVSLLVLPPLVLALSHRERGRPRGRASRAAASGDAAPGVVLPPEARAPVRVFFDGVELRPGRDYELRGQRIVLRSALQPYAPSAWREFITTAAGVGFYGRGAHLDLQYSTAAGGRDSRLLPVIPLDVVTASDADVPAEPVRGDARR
jgi:hypothetical protein